MVKRLVMCVGHIRVRGLDGQEVGHVCGTYLGLDGLDGQEGWSCVWDISRVRGLDGLEVGHVCGTYPGLEV